jgi:hypothetical protein
MPILGIIASQISGHLYPTTGFVSIATQTVGSGGAASVEFTNIPNVYKHLQIRCLSRMTSTSIRVNMQVGNTTIDTGSNYNWHSLGGDGVSAFGYTPGPNLNYIQANSSVQSSEIANAFGVGIIDILDYASTNKNKTFRMLTGTDLNSYAGGNYFVGLNSGAWFSTSAIDRIKLYPNGAGNIAQYSQFALYGIQGA